VCGGVGVVCGVVVVVGGGGGGGVVGGGGVGGGGGGGGVCHLQSPAQQTSALNKIPAYAR